MEPEKRYHLVQYNIARMVAPLDDPIMADFVARLEEINGLAEKSPGFVWRLQTPAGDSTSIRIYDDPNWLVNMSMWEDIDSLHQYAYYSDHVEVFRRRGDWFEKPTQAILVMWWVPAGTIPTAEDGKAKLEYLREHGASPLAFTFKERFSVEELLAMQPE